MRKTFLIIGREYLTRVKKKSFLIMTLLGPFLIAALMLIPAFLGQIKDEAPNLLLLDESHLVTEELLALEGVVFTPFSGNVEAGKAYYKSEGLEAFFHVPTADSSNLSPIEFDSKLYAEKQLGIGLIQQLQGAMRHKVESIRMAQQNIDPITLAATRSQVSIQSILVGEDGQEEKSSLGLNIGAGVMGGILIYMFIFIYGAMVMRGVIEEKTNRVVEVIVSSVKPFQLMLGKIMGIALVGFTQFTLWVLLSLGLVIGVSTVILNQVTPDEMVVTGIAEQLTDATGMDFFQSLGGFDFGLLLGCFAFYFIAGYLLYGALFAAVGSAVDSEAETQQFMIPITIPLILSYISSMQVIEDPNSPLAFWMSIIPLTSPIVMMVRLPFGVPVPELLLSMALLVAGFFFTTWLAARIYRVGILMYGKKVSYKELWKWLRY